MKKIIVVLLIASLLLTACAQPVEKIETVEPTTEIEQEEVSAEPTVEPTSKPTDEPTPVPLPMKVAVVVARDSYAASELNPVLDALEIAGYEPIIVSDELGQAKGGNESVEVEQTFNDTTGDSIRGIVLIGGSESLWENADLHRLLNEVDDLDRVVSAICLASVTLAKAGVIKEGDEACWYNWESSDSAMKEAGVIDSGQLVTVNGNIITGNGPPAASEFAEEIVNALDAQ